METVTGKPWIDNAYTIWVCQCCMITHANGECCTDYAPMHSDGTFCFNGAANCFRSHGTLDLAIRDEYTPRFGRQVLTLWSGSFSSDPEGAAWELPGHNGFMVNGGILEVRIECESPRTDENFKRVDATINAGIQKAVMATAPLLHGGDGIEPLSAIGPDDGLAMGIGHEEHSEDCEVRKQGTHSIGNYECDCERTEFSRSQCDGCGSYLHGTRYAMTVFPGERAR